MRQRSARPPDIADREPRLGRPEFGAGRRAGLRGDGGRRALRRLSGVRGHEFWRSELRSVEEILGARRIVVAANGLDFEVFEAGGGQRLALLLHGFPQSALEWRGQMRTLLAKGFRVWAVNQRGYCGTSRPRHREDYRLANLLADIAGLIDASGASSVVLIGHDWGGLLAFAFAARGLRPLERLVTLNGPHPRCFARALQTPAQKRRSRYISLFRTPLLPEWLLSLRGGALIEWIFRKTARRGAFEDEIIAIYRADACRPGALTAMLDWYRVAAPEIFATEERADRDADADDLGRAGCSARFVLSRGNRALREEFAHRAPAARHALDPGGRRARGQCAARRVALGAASLLLPQMGEGRRPAWLNPSRAFPSCLRVRAM